MSPLGVVAASGLLLGTVMTMVMIPVLYDLIMSISDKISETKGAQVSKVIAVLMLFGAGAAIEVRADELTVEDCLRFALASSPAVLISDAEIDSASGQEAQSAAAMQPNLRLAAFGRHWDQKRPGVQGAVPGAPQFFDEDLTEVQLQMRQLIWDAGRSRTAFDAARYETTARKLQKERIEQETIFAVLSACIEVLNQLASREAVAKNVQDVTSALDRM